MTTAKTKRQITNYLDGLDDSLDYPADFKVFISELNKLIEIPIQITTSQGTGGESYTLGYLLALPGPTKLGFDLDTVVPYVEDLTNPDNLATYYNALESLLQDLSQEKTIKGTSGEDITIKGMGNTEFASDIYDEVITWNTTSTPTISHSASNPKVASIVAAPSQGEVETEAGEKTIYGSKDYYSGPNIPIDEFNQYIDAKTGEPKKFNGEIIKPWFRKGTAASMFEGLSQDAIFNIQQELASIGLDIGGYDFVPGSVNFQSGEEIEFIAQLMMEANDLNALYPNLNVIDKEATTLMGQLNPYIEYKKKNKEEVNAFYDKARVQFADEILPPTESEVKAAVDSLFAERGINPTARDYEKYASIFTGLKKQEAARDKIIEKNNLSLGDVIGLSKGKYSVPGGGDLTDIIFGVDMPTPEEARQKLGKPLMGRFDVQAELGKVMDDLEAGRIDASQEILARTQQAALFKKNFMEFEEAF